MGKKIFLIIIVFGLVLKLHSSNFVEDMQKVRTAYSENYMSMTITYNLYSKANNKQAQEIQTLYLESYQNLLYYKGEGQEVLYTDKYLLMLNEEDKEIVLDTVFDQYNRPEYQVLPMDTTASKMQSITSEELGSGKIKYTLIPKDKSEVSKVVFELNTTTWLISKIEMYAGTGMEGKVIIVYSNVKKQSKSPEGSFSLSKFLRINTKGGFEPTSMYKHYTLQHRKTNF